MASIYQRGRVWYLNWRDPQTKRRHREPIGAVTEREANLALKAKEVELGTGHSLLARATAGSDIPQFGKFAIDYYEWFAHEYPSSAVRMESILGHLVPFFKFDRLDQIKPKKVEDYKRMRMQEPCMPTGRKDGPKTLAVPNGAKSRKLTSAGTVTKELKAFKAMLNRAVEWGIIEAHPFPRVSAPANLRSKIIGYYTPEQLQELYKHSRPPRLGEFDYAPVWQFLANTGLRRGEALKARKSDVINGKLAHKELPDRSFIAVESIPDNDERTKSGKLRRVPLNSAALAALEHLGNSHLLPRVTPESLTRAFARCARQAGLRGSIHWLRHTFGSNLVLNGVPLIVVKELMGHASITTTEQYAHLMPDHLAGAVDRIAL